MPHPFASRSFRWWCAVWIGLVLFVLFAYRTGAALYHNHQLRVKFSAAANASPYQQKIPLEKMDLAAYAPYFPTTFTLPEVSLTHRMESPVTLLYYTEIPAGNTAAALEIAKGTTIVAIPEETKGFTYLDIGYGYTSYPTYKKGWRYVRPFKTTENANPAQSERYYYIKVESLEAVMEKAIESNRPFRVAVQQNRWTLDKGKHDFLYYIDGVLYRHGAYLSPDLFRRVFANF